MVRELQNLLASWSFQDQDVRAVYEPHFYYCLEDLPSGEIKHNPDMDSMGWLAGNRLYCSFSRSGVYFSLLCGIVNDTLIVCTLGQMGTFYTVSTTLSQLSPL